MAKRTAGEAQLDLFGGGEGSPASNDGAGDDEAAWDHRRALAARVPAYVHLGTSSWTFPGWAGLVYRRRYPTKAAFTHGALLEYAAHPLFRTVCLDRAYYAPVPREDLAEYASQVPEDFRFVSKVWSDIATRRFPKHPRYGEQSGAPNANFLNVDLFLERVWAPLADELGGKAGPVLLEIPPAPGPADATDFVASLAAFLEALPKGIPLALELRDPRLLTEDYFALLREHSVGHVLNYWSRMPSIAEQAARAGVPTASFVVVRLMLPPGRKYEALKEAWAPFDQIVEVQQSMRDQTLDAIVRAGLLGKDVFVIVNNKAEGSSPRTVEALAEGLAARLASR